MIEKLIAEEIERIKETGRYDERLQNASKAAKGIKIKGSWFFIFIGPLAKAPIWS